MLESEMKNNEIVLEEICVKESDFLIENMT